MEFLNKEGVQILWSKVKDKVSSINKESVGLNNVTNDAQVKRSEMGAANGVPTLDANGKIPVDQLGNLDTVVAMVVTELPTTDIKTNKIYLVKDSTTEGDLYQEYLYVDNKWEKVGTHKQEVDLTDYAKKNEAVKSLDISQNEASNILKLTAVDGTFVSNIALMPATSGVAGLMTADDKAKLDGIAADANKYTLPIASATALGGIKLGSGLSATSDGTVSVSADVVAGSVEWDSIKNKPEVARVDNQNRFRQSQYISGNLYIKNDADDNIIEISNEGGIFSFGENCGANKYFATDGTIQELTAIKEDELNEILV